MEGEKKERERERERESEKNEKWWVRERERAKKSIDYARKRRSNRQQTRLWFVLLLFLCISKRLA